MLEGAPVRGWVPSGPSSRHDTPRKLPRCGGITPTSTLDPMDSSGHTGGAAVPGQCAFRLHRIDDVADGYEREPAVGRRTWRPDVVTLATREVPRARAAERSRQLQWLMAVLAGTVPLLLYGRRDLWADETVSAYLAALPATDLLQVLVQRELNGALHSVLLWTLPLGSADEWLLRLPSAVAIGVACLLIMRLLSRLVSPVWALVGGAVFAALPGVVEAAVSARSYALAVLTVALLAWLAERLTPARSLAYGVVAGLGLYAHFFVALVVVGHLVYLLLTRDPVLRRRSDILRAAVPLTLLALPLALFLFTPGNAGQVSWVPEPTPRLVLDYVARSVVGITAGDFSAVVTLLAVLLAAPALAALLALGRSSGAGSGSRRRCALLGLTTALSVVALAAAISLAKPLFVPRYLWLALPGVVLLMVAGAASLPRLVHPVAVAAWAAAVVSALSAFTPGTEAWGSAAAAVRERAAPGDAVDTYWTFLRPALTYYAPDQRAVDWAPFGPPSAEEFLTSATLDRRRTCLRPPPGGALWLLIVTGREEGPVASCTGTPVEVAVDHEDYRVLVIR